jgi:hypothetical protein
VLKLTEGRLNVRRRNIQKERADVGTFRLESAPASNKIQGAVKLPEVRQTMPTLASSNRSAISLSQRAPFSIPDEIHGSTAWITWASHAPSPSATALLRSPDQLKNAFTNKHHRRIVWHPAIKNNPSAILAAPEPIYIVFLQLDA